MSVFTSRWSTRLLLALVCAAPAGVCKAGLVTAYHVSGSVAGNSSLSAFGQQFQGGERFDARFSFEHGSLDSDTDPNVGQYQYYRTGADTEVHFTLTVGTTTIVSTSYFVKLENNRTGTNRNGKTFSIDQLTLRSLGNRSLTVGGQGVDGFMRFSLRAGEFLASDQLEDVPDLSAIALASFNAVDFYVRDGSNDQVRFDVDSITPNPEPSTIAMAASGAVVGLVWYGRRRKVRGRTDRAGD